MTETTVLIAQLMHESNTFVSETTTRRQFEDRRELVGAASIEELAGTNDEIGGIIATLSSDSIEILPTIAAKATPGGVVTRETFERYWTEIERTIDRNAGQIDGVILSLHGAMVLDDHDNGDGLLLSRVREGVGEEVPIVASVDLHANMTNEMIENADAIVAYEEYPHTDMHETGSTAAELLLRVLRGNERPRMHLEHLPLIVPGSSQNTSDDPMNALMGRARTLERRPEVLKVNITPGFFRADVPTAGFAVSTVATTTDAARTVAREVAETIWDHRSEFRVEYPEPDAAVDRATTMIEDNGADATPVVLADVGDNPGGGATGDETALLRELLERRVSNAGVATIHDPAVVERCIASGVGTDVTVDIGGKKPDSHTEPIRACRAYVKSITDGSFVNTGPMQTGTSVDLGSAALLECGDAKVKCIVTEKRVQPMDAEIWRHVGVQPERLSVIVVKSSNHYRADYETFADTIVPVGSPGVNTVDPTDYEYRKLRGPNVPLETVESYPDWR